MGRQIINGMIQSMKQVDGLSEDLIFVVDDRFVLQYVGGNLARRSKSYENALGSRLMRAFPHCGKLLEPAIQRVLDSGKRVSLENVLCAGGEEFWLDIRLAPIRNEFGKNIAVMAACRDITVRKRSEESLIRSKQNWLQAVDNMPYLLAVVDSRHRVERINAAIEGMHRQAVQYVRDETATIESLLSSARGRTDEIRGMAAGLQAISERLAKS